MLRDLEFWQERRRADVGIEARERGQRHAAIDRRISWDTRHDISRVVEAEGILLCVGIVTAEADAEFTYQAWRNDPRPPDGCAVIGQLLAAKCRGRSAVGQSAEIAGDETRPGCPTVAREHSVARSGRPVDAAAVAVVVIGKRGVAGEVIVLAGKHGEREQRHHLLHGSIQPVRRNLIVGEGLLRGGIEDGWIRAQSRGCGGCRAEIADPLVRQGHGGDAGHSIVDARALPIEESEELVLDYRTAKIAAELIPLVLRLVESVSVGEEIVGIQRAVAQILIQQPVDLVGSTLGGDHYRRSRAAPVLGRVGIGDDFEFLNIVHGGPHGLRT